MVWQRCVTELLAKPGVSEVWVSWAEMALQASPPLLDEARGELERAAAATSTAAASERSDYLRIWVEDAAGADESKIV